MRLGLLTAMSLLGLCGALVVAGCSSSSTPGQAAPVVSPNVSNSPAAPITGPRTRSEIATCTDLTPANLRTLGLDPASKADAGINGGQVSEVGCQWTGNDILVSVSTTNATVALYKTRNDLADAKFPVVAGLPSISFHGPDDPDGCSLISDIPGGGLVVQLRIKFEHDVAVGTDACAAAVRVMEQVAPLVLKQK